MPAVWGGGPWVTGGIPGAVLDGDYKMYFGSTDDRLFVEVVEALQLGSTSGIVKALFGRSTANPAITGSVLLRVGAGWAEFGASASDIVTVSSDASTELLELTWDMADFQADAARGAQYLYVYRGNIDATWSLPGEPPPTPPDVGGGDGGTDTPVTGDGSSKLIGVRTHFQR